LGFIFLNVKSTFFILFLLILNSCWEKKYDYVYDIWLENATNDTITVLIGMEKLNIDSSPYRTLTFNPYDTLNGNKSALGGLKVNEEINVVQYRFQKGWENIDTVLVYRNDTLKCIWTAPASSKPDSVHDFFNYNSWKTWMIDKRNGVMMFTVYPDDLKLNN